MLEIVQQLVIRYSTNNYQLLYVKGSVLGTVVWYYDVYYM